MNNSQMEELILKNTYILWLSDFIEKYGEFDDIYFVRKNKDKLNKDDLFFINSLKDLFIELNKYTVKHNLTYYNIFEYYIKYQDNIYHIFYNNEGYSCKKVNTTSDIKYIDYKSLRREYKKNMDTNFQKLKSRVLESLYNSDLEKINYELSKIEGPTLISGVGGSSVVAEFASKILTKKNYIITKSVEPRDLRYLDTTLYKNVLSCSYSGENYGVDLSFLNNLKHYLLSSNENKREDITNLTYNALDKEHSFISLAATLIPCNILLNYYLNNEKETIIDNLGSYKFNFDVSCDAFEIFTGIDTSTASKYLESTMIESGIGIPIIHDKYAYCHGRSTISTVNNNIAIFLDTGTELDKLLLEQLPKYYKDMIVLKNENSILGEYITLIKCMYLTKYIAEEKGMDLSGVDYNPIVKKLYKYNGNL